VFQDAERWANLPVRHWLRIWRRRRIALFVAALLAAVVLLAGCGVPGEPLPPLLEIPAPVSDLAVAQIGAKAELTWSKPALTTQGTRPRRLDRFEIYGAFLGSDSAVADFTGHSRLLATIPNASAQPPQINYDVSLTRANIGQKAFFAVKALNWKGKAAGFSNIVSVEIADLPEAPLDLEAKVTEKAIQLAWKPAAVSGFGGPSPQANGYQIFRSEAQSPQPAQQIGTADGLKYEDAAFEFGHTYTYFVRAFVRAGTSTVATRPSPSVQVAAVDVFPPAAPRNFRVIAVPGAAEMAWSPNSEADLAGYNVYRSGGAEFVKRNAELLTIPVYRDATVSARAHYTYRVTAVDKSGNESLPSEDVSVTAE